MTFFTELKEIILKFVGKYKRPQIYKTILRKRRHLEVSYSRLQSYNLQNSTIVRQKQIYGPMEQSREPRSKPTHLQPIYNKGGKHVEWRKEDLFKKWRVLGKLDSYM